MANRLPLTCGINGECTDGVNEYICQCEAGYFGINCNNTCPIDKPMTKKIDDGCYFFNKEKLSFDQAKEKCNSYFDGIGGKMAEPKTKAFSDRLYEESVSMFGGASSFNTAGTYELRSFDYKDTTFSNSFNKVFIFP